MKLYIEIDELKNGDVAVHIKSNGDYVTPRENYYADAITEMVKDALKVHLPRIVKSAPK